MEDHNLLKLPIMKGALKNKKVTHLSVDICNDTELLEVLNELEREPSPGHLTNITLTARFHDHVNFDNFREMEIRGCAQLCSCLKLQPICILSLGLMIEDCRLLLSNLCFALCLEELYLTENDAGINNCSSKSDSCSSTKNDEVKMSLAQCKLKILRMQHNCYGWDFDDIPLTSPKWSTLYGAVLEGLASNHCQVDFIDFTLFGENLNISAIQSTLQPEVIRKFDFNEYYCDWCSVMIIFFCQPVPNDNPAQEMPDPPIAAPRCFNSRVFMKKYSSFPVEVKAKSIALKLRNNEAISAALLHNIDQTYEEEAGQLLYKELLGRGTPSQIRTVCEAMRDEEGNPQMNQLGRDMLDDEDLPPESIGAC